MSNAGSESIQETHYNPQDPNDFYEAKLRRKKWVYIVSYYGQS